ncbi:MAG: multidrug efflux RND transporter permease subunit [Cyanobacteriota bacterium]
MSSNFFINRPRFAIVISLVIMLVGLIALQTMPLESYPIITPPQVVVSAPYPGANADVVAKTIAAPIESEINGVENMIYMESESTNGSYNLRISFEVGSDPDMAVVKVQNRLSLVTPKLPEEVRRLGVLVRENTGGPGVLFLGLKSDKKEYNNIFLSNYALVNIKDILSRVPGVADVRIFGAQDYSMRIWLNPEKMANLAITTRDVISAIQSQNIQIATGQLGDEPAPEYQQLSIMLRTQGRYTKPSEFEEIIIKANNDGSTVKIKDIADVELGSFDYSSYNRVNGKPSVVLAISQLNDANIIELVKNVDERLSEIKKNLPAGVELDVLHDASDYIEESIEEVTLTIVIALILVTLITYMFLQDIRTTIIPILAIPVSIIGTFSFLKALGFSINTFTLFGLVLAIGIVVDDAIVVIENVQRHISNGMHPKEAAIKTMKEVSGAVIATTLVLLAVFVPIAFLPGITGRLYKQFASAISISVTISSIVALTLTPALSATILSSKISKSNWFWDLFNYGFELLKRFYLFVSLKLIKQPVITVLILAGLFLSTIFILKIAPTGFLPDEDQGIILSIVQLPDGASLNRTNEVVKKVENILKEYRSIERVISVIGYQGTNSAIVITRLKPWNDRIAEKDKAQNIVRELQGKFMAIPDAQIYPFSPPSIPGLGMFGGFEFRLQDKGDNSPQYLSEVANDFIAKANQNGYLQRVFTQFQANLPQLYVTVDREKAMAKGVEIDEIFSTLGALLGSVYVNDFNKLGRIFQVKIQAKSNYRSTPDDLKSIYVRNNKGEMIPISSLITLKSTIGAKTISRFNMFKDVKINGNAAMGRSTGEAIKAMEELANTELPDGFSYEWSATSLQEKQSSNKTNFLLILSVVFIYLFLIAFYESWAIPFAVILVAPLGVIGGLAAILATGNSLDLYAQIGLVILIGISSKHAILIVEFAKAEKEQNNFSPLEAAVSAAKLRIRAVVMTVLTFIFSVIPLIIAQGAGAESRHSLGITVFGGMIAAAIVGTILVPSTYVIIETLREKFSSKNAENIN